MDKNAITKAEDLKAEHIDSTYALLSRAMEKIEDRKARLAEMDAKIKIAREQEDWLTAIRLSDQRRNSIKELSIYFNEDAKRFSVRIVSLWRDRDMIHDDIDCVCIPGKPIGLLSEIMIKSEYEQGYHNDSGQSNEFYIVNSSFADLAVDLDKFTTHFSIEKIPADVLLRTLFDVTLREHIADA